MLDQDGELPVSQVLRPKVRYFTDGMVPGSRDYVDGIFDLHPTLFGKYRKTGTRPMRGFKNSGQTVIRDLSKAVFT